MIGARAKVDVNVGERRAKKVAVCIELLVVRQVLDGVTVQFHEESCEWREIISPVRSY